MAKKSDVRMEVIDQDTGEVAFAYPKRNGDAVPVYRMRERPRFTKEFRLPTRTKQEFRDECDINVLMKRYQKTGLFPQYPGQAPRYVSNIDMPEYQEALHIVMQAQQEFAGLNSELRKRFDNDPAKFLEFVNDPANADELVALKLREAPKPEPGPVRVEVVNPPSDDPK